MGLDTLIHLLGRWRVRYPSAYKVLAITRPLLEGTIRHRLTANPRVTFMQGVEAIGLYTDETQTRAAGVQLRRRQGGEAFQIEADLVVAATGRNSRAADWLAALNFPTPRETVVDAKAGYATRLYRFSQPPTFDWKALYMQPLAPDQQRGAIFMKVEGDQWQATLIGMAGDYPPTDEDAYLDYAHTLPAPEFLNAIQSAEPISPIWGYRRMENRLRHYEDLPRYLENFLVCGDAVYAFNPAYGQGMSVAAIASMKLDNCLRRQGADLTGLAARFQKELIKVIDAPWQLATGQDRDWLKGSDESKSRMDRLVQSYFRRVLESMMYDVKVSEAFLAVQHMIASPTRLFYPDVLWRTLRPQRQILPRLSAPTEVPSLSKQVDLLA